MSNIENNENSKTHTFEKDNANDVFAFVHNLGSQAVHVFLRTKDGNQEDVESQVQDGNLVIVRKPGGYDEGDTIVVQS